jgi:hypothetical protein
MNGKLDALGKGLSTIAQACRAVVGPRRLLQGSGVVIVEDREVGDVCRVSLVSAGRVILTQGQEESLKVESDENLLPYIAAVARGGTLALGFTKAALGLRIRPTVLRYHLTLETIAALRLAGVGDIRAPSLDVGALEIDLSGAGDVAIASLHADKLAVCLDGLGNVELGGQATEQEVRISGSGTYHAGELESEAVDAMVSGMGDATVWATRTLRIRIPGDGSVKYYGRPEVRSRVGSLGQVISLGEPKR